MSGQPDPPNWADMVAAGAAVAGLIFTVLVQIWAYIGANQRRLQTSARRLNDSMCVLDVTYDATSMSARLQLEVAAIWPRGLFLLPDSSVVTTNPLGERTLDGDWLGRQGAITCRMDQKDMIFFAGAHVWRMDSIKAAWLLVTIRDRSNQKAIARRIVRIRPMLDRPAPN